ncbi:hypothetical protein U8V72_14570 [Priestia filamentosa]|uniref:hypothetical protein n=1 Tax=Priestia filamentosa TaxID=1402861 RepID=UPI00397BD6DF
MSFGSRITLAFTIFLIMLTYAFWGTGHYFKALLSGALLLFILKAWIKGRKRRGRRSHSERFNYFPFEDSTDSNNYSNSESIFGSSKKDDKAQRMKEAQESADFHRHHNGPAWKVKEADDYLGRSTREREYENEKYNYRP